MAKKNKTTEDDFAVFKATAEYLIKELGLLNWSVTFVHEDSVNAPDSRAYIASSSGDSQIATIGLTKAWYNTKPTREAIMLSAFHEVKHLLLGTLYNVALYDDLLTAGERDAAYRRAEHEVICRMENVIFPLMLPGIANDLEQKGILDRSELDSLTSI